MDSNTENPDLEDGEIEDDEEDQIVSTPLNEERNIASATFQTTKSSNRGKTDKGPRNTIVDDDFAGKIESMIAIVLKKDGIEPPLPEISRSQEKENCNDVQRQSKRKKRGENYDREREKKKKLDKSLMEAEEDEFEFLCVRGASPPPIQQQSSTYSGARTGVNDDSYESDYSGSSYESYSSPDRHRVLYAEKRNRGNRDRTQRSHRSGGQKEKHHNKRHQSRSSGTGNGQNDGGLDSDDERNRKMELCKFYLMDCCAKRDKCLYMHSDFPCKYYYLGIRCVSHDKGTCKFLHGAPLTDNVRSILLKHLETAPKEILGDFPRLSRDNAIKMLDSTHQKLLIDYGMAPKSVAPLASSSSNPVVANKIPSLLEINIAKPASLIEKEDNLMNKSLKPRRTRWCATSSNNGGGKAPQNSPVLPSLAAVATVPPVGQTKNSFLSLKFLTNVLSQTQIENLENLGIETLEQVNQLTVAQLNELGLTVDQIRAIQLNAMNIQKLGLLNNSTSDAAPVTTTTTTTVHGDLDMRITAPAKSAGEQTTQSDSDTISLNPGGGDVDMRVLPLEPLPPVTKPQDDPVIQSNQPTSINTDYSKFMMSPPSSIDYSKYLKDSNLENILENNSDSEEEENLKIDDEVLAIATTSEPLVPSMTSPPIISSVCLTSLVPTKILPLSLPVTVSSEISAASKTKSTCSGNSSSEVTRIDFYNPRLSPTLNTTHTYSEELSPTIPVSTASIVSPKTSGQRVTIYDRMSDEDVAQDKQAKTDRDMRLNSFLESSDSNGDIDFRLPFKPIPNYVPATEIDASFTSHSPIEYKLVKIIIPKPDYSDIRRSFPIPSKTLDPRLRRIFALKELSDEKSYQDITSPTDPFQTSVTSPSDTGIIMPRIDPRADPRRKKDAMPDNTTIVSQASGGSGAGGNKSLDIQIMLQNSLWYRDLSSKQKMSVNQHLATLTAELKQFHVDPNPDKKFDTNIIIQQTLTNLGVYVNESGDFIELCDNTGMGLGGIMMNPMIGGPGHKLPQNHMMNLMNMHAMESGGSGGGGYGNINSTGPNFNPRHPHSNINPIQMFPSKQFDGIGGGSIRPGLLGIAPNMPYNYDPNLAFQQQTLQFEEFIDNNINNNRFDRGDGIGGGGGNRNFNRNNFRGGNGNMRNNNDRWRNTNMNRNNNLQRRPMYDRDNRRHD